MRHRRRLTKQGTHRHAAPRAGPRSPRRAPAESYSLPTFTCKRLRCAVDRPTTHPMETVSSPGWHRNARLAQRPRARNGSTFSFNGPGVRWREETEGDTASGPAAPATACSHRSHYRNTPLSATRGRTARESTSERPRAAAAPALESSSGHQCCGHRTPVSLSRSTSPHSHCQGSAAG